MQMKFNVRLLLICFITSLILVTSCEDPCTTPCNSPDSIGILEASTPVSDEIYDFVFIWTPVLFAESYEVSVLVNGQNVIDGGSIETPVAQIALSIELQQEDVVTVSVVTNCTSCEKSNDPVQSKPAYLVFNHANGGATVDPIPMFKQMGDVCAEQIDCQFIHFPDAAVALCDSTTLDLNLNQSFLIYFDRQAVCACLNANPDLFCDKVANISDCLNQRYFKYNYGFCQ